MSRAHTIAFANAELDTLAAALSGALGIPIHQRRSDHWGQYWSGPLETEPHIKVYENREPEDGEPHHDDPDVTVLLDSSNLNDDQIQAAEKLGGKVIASFSSED